MLDAAHLVPRARARRRLGEAVRSTASSWRRSGTAIPSGQRTRCAGTSPASTRRSGACCERDPGLVESRVANSYITTGAHRMTTFPREARAVVIGGGIVGNSLAYHLARLGWTRPRPARQGPAAEPRRLDGSRLQLHLPGRPLEGDDRAHAREHAPVQGAGRLHRVRRDRGRAHRGAACRSCPARSPPRSRGASSPSRS